MSRPGLGTRAFAMVVCAILWALLGLGIILANNPPAPGTLHGFVPRWAEGAAWIASAAVAFTTAMMSRRGRDVSPLGLSALVLAPVFRIVSFSAAWVASLLPGGAEGLPFGWWSAAIYSILLAFVWIVAKIPAQAPPLLAGPPVAHEEDRAP